MSRYHYSTEITDYQQVHSDIDMDYAFAVATCMMTDVNATFLLMSPCSILAVNAFPRCDVVTLKTADKLKSVIRIS